MAKSNVERQRLFREKNKNNQAFKEKEKVRHRKYRAAGGVANDRAREKTKERLRKMRQSKIPETAAAYSSDRAAARAINRSMSAIDAALPRSPRRRAHVALKVARMLSPLASHSRETLEEPASMRNGELRSAVKAFYNKDEISRVAPGKRDYIIIRKQGEKKQYVQKRHLYMSLKETHANFLQEFPERKIGFSLFASLRPSHVLLQSQTPHNVCVCHIHANFIALVNELSSVSNIPRYDGDWVSKYMCEECTFSCWVGDCSTCCDGGLIAVTLTPSSSLEEIVSPKLWSKTDGVFTQSADPMTINSLQLKVKSGWQTFIKHHHAKREQSFAYEEAKRKALATPNNVLCQIDFSENYTCVSQDEIQSAHWNQTQISLFTACVWSTSASSGPISFVVASDNRDHNKESATVYLYYVIQAYKNMSSEPIQYLRIFSDGPASQFKNRYMAAMLQHLRQHWDLEEMRWSFSATSHGKGPVDGIGGMVKRVAWQQVRTRKASVTNAETFVSVVQPLTTTTILLDTPEQFAEIQNILQIQTIFSNAPYISGISEDHDWISTAEQPFSRKFLSSGNDLPPPAPQILKIVELTNDTPVKDETLFVAGQWVQVTYDGETFPGEIVETLSEQPQEYRVKVMHPWGLYWRWPERDDIALYLASNVLKRIEPPLVVGSRGQYNFENF